MKHTFTNILRHSAGIFLVFGISLISGSGTIVYNAQLLSGNATLPLQAAYGAEQAATVEIQLALGMLMILTALFFYTLWIVQKKQSERATRTTKFMKWVHERLDRHIRVLR